MECGMREENMLDHLFNFSFQLLQQKIRDTDHLLNLALVTYGSSGAFGFWFACKMFWTKRKLYSLNPRIFIAFHNINQRQLSWHNQE